MAIGSWRRGAFFELGDAFELVRRGSAVLATASLGHVGHRMRSSVLYLVFNFGASVLIIFVNKSLFSGGLRFESACTLNCG